MINGYGVPFGSSHPRWMHIASVDTEMGQQPTEAEWKMIRSYIEFQCSGHGYYSAHYGQKILAHPEIADAGHNTVTFHKRGDGDWGYRRATWTQGPLFWPQPRSGDYAGYGNGGEPMDLPALLDKVNDLSGSWPAWKDDHAELALASRDSDVTT